MEWQDIETAPKDGTEISIWTERDGWIPFVSWEDDGWISHTFAWSGTAPTHWMPHPSRPE